jgi:hypothetical protein
MATAVQAVDAPEDRQPAGQPMRGVMRRSCGTNRSASASRPAPGEGSFEPGLSHRLLIC